jgi:AraC family transcriptional regulator
MPDDNDAWTRPMTGQASPYASFIDHYEATRSAAIVEIKRPKCFGAMLMARQTDGDWSDPPTQELGFSIITGGVGTYSADLGAGRFRSTVRRGETIMVGPGAGASIQRHCSHSIISYSFPYAELLEMVGDHAALPPDGNFGALHAGPLTDPLICSLLQRLWQEASRGNPSYGTLQEGAITTIMALLLGSYKEPSARPRHTPLATWQANRAIAMMKGNIDRDLPLQELAKEVRLSPYHFARAFKSTTGQSPGRYHQMLRIDHAKQILIQTSCPISEVAAAIGYADPSHLARIFQRETGSSPAAFRRVNRATPIRTK